MDARALDQRHRQSVVRLPDLGRGRGVHVGDQQPAAPADPLVERPGERPARRGALRARRGRRRALDADGAADSRGRASLCRQPWPGLQPVRARLARHRARAAAVRAVGRPDQDLPADDHESVGPVAPPLDHRVRGVGAGPVARRFGAVRRDGDRSRDPRDARAQPLERPGSAAAWRSPTSAGARRRGRATGRNSSAATGRSTPRPRWPTARLSPIGSAAASIPAAPCRRRWSSRRTARRRSCSCLARPRRGRRPCRWSRATGPPISTRSSAP